MRRKICLYYRCCVWMLKLRDQRHTQAHTSLSPYQKAQNETLIAIGMHIPLCSSHLEGLNDIMGPLKRKKHAWISLNVVRRRAGYCNDSRSAAQPAEEYKAFIELSIRAQDIVCCRSVFRFSWSFCRKWYTSACSFCCCCQRETSVSPIAQRLGDFISVSKFFFFPNQYNLCCPTHTEISLDYNHFSSCYYATSKYILMICDCNLLNQV